MGLRVNLWGVGLALPLLGVLLFQVADSCGVIESVNGLVEVEGVFYSFGEVAPAAGPAAPVAVASRYDPAGNRWERVAEPPEAVVEREGETADLPLTRCVADDPALCYRIEGEEAVLVSEDGGESWKTAWRVPAGRRLFMARAANICTGRVVMGPFDLLVAGTADNHQVMAAMGTEGVVVREGDGDWERQAVLNARPTPFRAMSLLEILVTVPTELAGWLLFVFIYGVGQYLFFMRRLRLILTPLTWAALISVVGSLYLFYALITWGLVPDWELLLLIVAAYCLPVYLAYRKWVNESYNMMDDPEKGERAGRIWMASTIGLLLGGMVVLSLWPVGILPYYWLMVLVVLGLALGGAWWGSNRIQALMAEGN